MVVPVELAETLVVNVLVKRKRVEYLSIRAALGASNSESDTSKIIPWTNK